MSGPNVENIRKWVDALRSGDYAQARGKLARVRGEKVTHCCLGVACAISNAAHPEVVEGLNGWNLIKFDGARVLLPPSVRRWLGLPDESPWVGGNSLATINDNGATFAEIADLIEAEWLTEATA